MSSRRHKIQGAADVALWAFLETSQQTNAQYVRSFTVSFMSQQFVYLAAIFLLGEASK
jgi:hypothetical protein